MYFFFYLIYSFILYYYYLFIIYYLFIYFFNFNIIFYIYSSSLFIYLSYIIVILIHLIIYFIWPLYCGCFSNHFFIYVMELTHWSHVHFVWMWSTSWLWFDWAMIEPSLSGHPYDVIINIHDVSSAAGNQCVPNVTSYRNVWPSGLNHWHHTKNILRLGSIPPTIFCFFNFSLFHFQISKPADLKIEINYFSSFFSFF